MLGSKVQLTTYGNYLRESIMAVLTPKSGIFLFYKNCRYSKKLWSKINETLQNKNKNFEKIFISVDGKMITAHKTVASKFNNYFANVAKNLLKDIAESNKALGDFLNNPDKHSFFYQ